MKKILTNNLSLKIASVLIAIVIWFVVVKTSDPIATKSFDVPVTVENEAILKNMDLTYTMYEGDEVVNVRVRDNQSNLKNLKANDIKVTADLTQSQGLEMNPIIVPYEISVTDGILSDNHEFVQTKKNIRLRSEKISSKSMTVEVVIPSDSQPNSNYVVGKAKPDSEKQDIEISGPESVIDKVGRVAATVRVDGMTKSETKPATIEIYDKNDTPFTDEMKKYLTFDDDSETTPTVNVDIELWRKLSGVKLIPTTTGTPADGYAVKGVSVTPEEVTVAGSEDELAALEENNYEIAVTPSLDVSGKKEDFEETIEDITTLIPQDKDLRIIVGQSNENASKHLVIKVAIMPQNSKEFSLPVKNIETKNKASNLDIAYNNENVMLRIQADDDLLDKFDVTTMVKASIDLKGMAEGDHKNVNIEITLPDGYKLIKQATISFKLQKAVSSTSISVDEKDSE